MLEEVKKVYILAHESQKDLLKKIQKLSILHITEFEEEVASEKHHQEPGPNSDRGPEQGSRPRSDETKDLSAQISKVEETIRFLKELVPKEGGGMKGFIQDFFENKIDLNRNDYDSLIEKDHRVILSGCDDKRGELDQVREEINRKNELMEKLTPFMPMDLTFEELEKFESEKFEAQIGFIEAEVGEPDLYSEILSRDGDRKYIFIIYPKGEPPDGFQEVKFNLKGTPSQALKDLAERREEAEKRAEEINNDLTSMSSELLTLQAVRDHLATELARYEVGEKLARTEKTFAIRGWVRASDLDKLTSFTGPINIEVEDSGVEEDGDPPLAFKNSKLATPFELVTRMYGPTGAIDPTPYLTPFFMLFFAICVGDVFYGILLIFFSFLFLKLFKMGKEGKNLFHILIYSSLLMIPIGILTGSMFGDLFTTFENPLGNWLNGVRIIDPLSSNGVLIFLAFTIVLGLIQVYTGYGVKLYYHSRRSKKDAILDEGTWILFMTSGIVLLLSLADAMMGLNIGVNLTLGVGFFIGSLILLTVCRGRNEVGIKKLKGLASAYDLISVGTDVLSYSRLFALSVTTYILAMTFNLLAGMVVTGLPSPFGYIVGGLVFVVATLFILFVSTIGGFVHTTRLQLLEFFTKFVEGGETFFEPFTEEDKYMNVIG